MFSQNWQNLEKWLSFQDQNDRFDKTDKTPLLDTTLDTTVGTTSWHHCWHHFLTTVPISLRPSTAQFRWKTRKIDEFYRKSDEKQRNWDPGGTRRWPHGGVTGPYHPLPGYHHPSPLPARVATPRTTARVGGWSRVCQASFDFNIVARQPVHHKPVLINPVLVINPVLINPVLVKTVKMVLV